jgi:hypothetical protein
VEKVHFVGLYCIKMSLSELSHFQTVVFVVVECREVLSFIAVV